MLRDPHPRVLRAFRLWPAGERLLAAAMRGDRRARQIVQRRGICCGCLDRVVRFTWVTIADGRRQIRASCPHCRRHLYWAPHWPDIMLMTRPEQAKPMGTT
jgi:hypothetical protein